MTIRKSYPEGHPCYRCPRTDEGAAQFWDTSQNPPRCMPIVQGDELECEVDADCGPGKRCVDFECGPILEQPADDMSYFPAPPSAEDAIGRELDRITEKALPSSQFYRNVELPNKSAPIVHSATRDKIIVNRGNSYYLWDNMLWFVTAESLDVMKQHTNFQDTWGAEGSADQSPLMPQMSAGNNPGAMPKYGFAGLRKIYNPGSNYFRDGNSAGAQERGAANPRPVWGRSTDPLRWMCGYVWIFHQVHISPENTAIGSNFAAAPDYFFNASLAKSGSPDYQEIANYSFDYDIEKALYGNSNRSTLHQPNRPDQPLSYGGFMTLQFPQGSLEPGQDENPRFKYDVHAQKLTVEEDFLLSMQGSSHNHNLGLLKNLLSGYGEDTILPNRNYPEDPNYRIQHEEVLRYYFGTTGIDFESEQNSPNYLDFTFKAQMPFFGEEKSKTGVTSKLSAQVKLNSNLISAGTSIDPNRYQDYDGLEREMPNPYRLHRQRKNHTPDPDCQYNDLVQKFTAKNIKEDFKDVFETYKSQFPMSVEIEFDTTQVNNVADLFTQYKMDKYFLDLWDRPGFEPGKELMSVSEFLEQDVTFKSADRENSFTRDANYFVIDKNSSDIIKNEKFNWSSTLPTMSLERFFNLVQDREVMASFDETLFPLSVFPTDNRIDEDSEWSLALGQLNSSFLKSKINSLVWESYTDSAGPDAEGAGFEKKYFRTFQDILNGQHAYNEVIAYVVRKWDVTDPMRPQFVQSYYFSDSSSVKEIRFLDTQVKYDMKYRYYINAVYFVIGNQYSYNVMSGGHSLQFERPEGDDIDFLDETLLRKRLLDNVADQRAAEQRLQDLLQNAGNAGVDRPGVRMKSRTRPYMFFMEVPYFKKDIRTLDNPPLPPQVEILPYKGITDKVLLSLSPSGGSREEAPVLIDASDTALVELMHDTQGSRILPEDDPKYGVIKYSGDSLPSHYVMHIIEDPDGAPMGYHDFSSESGAPASRSKRQFGAPPSGNLHIDVDIRPNVKYYICFRSKDRAGISNPGEVYYLEMVSYAEGSYMILEPYSFPSSEATLKKDFHRTVSLVPKRKLLENTLSELFSQDKFYRVRIKSKNSGKTIDFDLRYSNLSVMPPAPTPNFRVPGEWEELEFCTAPNPDLPVPLISGALWILPGEQNQMESCAQEGGHVTNFRFQRESEKVQEEDQKVTFDTIYRSLRAPSSKFTRSEVDGACGCPPGEFDWDHLLVDAQWAVSGDPENIGNFLNTEHRRRARYLRGCMPEDFPCSADKVIYIARVFDDAYELACACPDDTELCDGECYEPCPPGEARSSGDCECSSVCGDGQVWGTYPPTGKWRTERDRFDSGLRGTPGIIGDGCYCPDGANPLDPGTTVPYRWKKSVGRCVPILPSKPVGSPPDWQYPPEVLSDLEEAITDGEIELALANMNQHFDAEAESRMRAILEEQMDAQWIREFLGPGIELRSLTVEDLKNMVAGVLAGDSLLGFITSRYGSMQEMLREIKSWAQQTFINPTRELLIAERDEAVRLEQQRLAEEQLRLDNAARSAASMVETALQDYIDRSLNGEFDTPEDNLRVQGSINGLVATLESLKNTAGISEGVISDLDEMISSFRAPISSAATVRNELVATRNAERAAERVRVLNTIAFNEMKANVERGLSPDGAAELTSQAQLDSAMDELGRFARNNGLVFNSALSRTLRSRATVFVEAHVAASTAAAERFQQSSAAATGQATQDSNSAQQAAKGIRGAQAPSPSGGAFEVPGELTKAVETESVEDAVDNEFETEVDDRFENYD